MKWAFSDYFWIGKKCLRLKPKVVHTQFTKRAFTIVELLVVIVVIGVLAAITIVSYTGIANKAIVSSLQSDLSNASTALKMFQVDNSAYPTTISTDCSASPTNATNLCLKASPGISYSNYVVSNTTNPQTFSINASKNNTYYRMSNNSNPSLVNPAYATGGTITTDGAYRIHTFISSGTFIVTTGGDVEVLVVAGGGGGGSRESGYAGGGGGGAGGLIYNPLYTVTSGSITVTIGAAGLGAVANNSSGGDGGNSIFGSITAIGGGGGGPYGALAIGRNGGSGGGAGRDGGSASGGTGYVGQGNNGGSGGSNPLGTGGGGGAGTIGIIGTSSGGQGGVGLPFTISGTAAYYAGGGGGAGFSGQLPNNGGNGGGGRGGSESPAVLPVAGTPNTGGGGGGGPFGASGGTGVVIIRYLST